MDKIKIHVYIPRDLDLNNPEGKYLISLKKG